MSEIQPSALLDLATALAAFAAAGFWFWSAATPIPRLSIPYGGQISDESPWPNAMRKVAVRSRWAAGFAGVSALFAFGSALLG